MKAYKGFNKDMTCRGFQYEEGKTYVTTKAELCECGFHACENPTECFKFYAPNNSVYHEVEVDVEDIVKCKDKLVAKKITIGKELTIADIVNERIKQANANIATEMRSANSATGYHSSNSTTGSCSANSATGDYSANSTTGNHSLNSATGSCSANSATGNYSLNSATGYHSSNSTTGSCSANSATGDYSANSTTGYGSVNSTTGDDSANSATGNHSVNSATGYGSVNSATGYCSANVSTGNESSNFGANGTINVGWGKDNKCSGKIGAFLVLCERAEWNGSKYPLIGKPVLIEIDGERYKEDTWYILKNGQVIEVE